MHGKRIAGIGVLLIIAVVAAVYVLLATYDYNKIKPWLARLVQEATGRELHLGGDINFSFGFPPALVASDAALANASWGSQPEMIKVENLRLEVRLLPLLSRTVELTHIGLAGVEVLVESDAKGRWNWIFKAAEQSGNKDITASDPLKLSLDRIHIEDLTLVFHKGKIKSAQRFHLARVDLARQGNGDTQMVDLRADYNKQPLAITGTTGAIEQLWAGHSFPVKLSATYAGAAASIEGKIEEVLQFKGVDLNLKVSGNELADLGPLVGAELPDLGAFDVQGRLSGSPQALSLKPLTAVIDKSDFKGRAAAAFVKRPKFTVRLDSSVIDFTALIKSLEKGDPKPAGKEKQGRRLFSDRPLPLDGLQKVDADIVLKAKHIHVRDARLELGHLALKLEDNDLHIEKLEATYKETRISGNLTIEHGTPPRVATDFLVQNLDLGSLLKEAGKSDEVRAIIDIAAHGTSTGNSVQGLMANLDGAIGVVMGKGYLTHYLDILSEGLSAKVIQFWDPPKAVDQINCAVVQFDMQKGVATSRAFVFDSRAGVIDGAGQINLGNEEIDFLLVPKPKHLELGIKPDLKVSGTVMEPQVGVAKLSLLTSGTKGLSELVVGPLGLLAPFTHLGAAKAHPCDVKGIGQTGSDTPDEKR